MKCWLPWWLLNHIFIVQQTKKVPLPYHLHDTFYIPRVVNLHLCTSQKHKAFWYMKHYDIIHRIHNNYKKKFDYHKYYYILMYVKVILWQSYKSFECQFHVNHIRWIQFYGYKILSLCKISMRINMFYNKIHFSDSKIKV